jgi:hypothetical protein
VVQATVVSDGDASDGGAIDGGASDGGIDVMCACFKIRVVTCGADALRDVGDLCSGRRC